METNLLKIKTESDAIIEHLARYGKGKVIDNNLYEKSVFYKNEIGEIDIKNNIINNTVSFLQFNLHFKQNTSIEIIIKEENPSYFINSSQGTINQTINNEERIVYEFQTEIFKPKKENSVILDFKKDTSYNFFIIQISETAFLNEKFKIQKVVGDNYSKLFSQWFSPKSSYVYTCSCNLKIYEYLRKMEAKDPTDLTGPMITKGIIYIILGLLIQQYIEDITISELSTNSLTQLELKKIKELTDYIHKNPEINYSIEQLCSMSGLSPYKLQEGFKTTQGRTVADFIRNVRIEKAEELIKTTDLNISEIVYTIGFTSRSYFSKIFKMKYNCSPKYYANNKQGAIPV